MNECPRRFGLVRRAQRCRRVFIHKFPCIATPDPCRRPRTGSRGHVLTRTPAKVPAVPAPCPPLQPGRVARAGLGVGGIQFASSEMREQDVVLPPDVVRGLRNPSGTRRIDTLSVGIGSLSGPDETADRSPTQRSNNTTPPRSGRLQIRMADIKWDSVNAGAKMHRRAGVKYITDVGSKAPHSGRLAASWSFVGRVVR